MSRNNLACCLFAARCTVKQIRQMSTYQLSLQSVFDEPNKTRVIEKIKSTKPVNRPDIKTTGREAGILIPLCHINGEPSVLFMVRSFQLNSHRGEVSFPGGMHDTGDKDIINTALRETEEEIGLDRNSVEVWGTLPALPSKTGGSIVTPVLGYCDIKDLSDLHLNPTEVESVFTRTIASFCESTNQRQTQRRVPGRKGYALPVFLGGEYKIWGLTAVVLHQTLINLIPELYKFKLKYRS
ncbi:nudix (nucleoside diphosphate linked moiety X)-type motif 8 [Mactra antiquata]